MGPVGFCDFPIDTDVLVSSIRDLVGVLALCFTTGLARDIVDFLFVDMAAI